MDTDSIETHLWFGNILESRRTTIGALIQEAYGRGDDVTATALLSLLDTEPNQPKKDTNYVLDEEETNSKASGETSVAFVREVIPLPKAKAAENLVLPLPPQQATAQTAQPGLTDDTATDRSTWFEGASSKEESDKAYAIMTSKKGTLEMENGDIVHNGRILKGGDPQMKESLAPLSPGLTIILKGLTSYIQLTVFDEEWLIKDQKAWSTRTTKSNKKESGEARIYGGEAPVEELTIDFEVWNDCMELFCGHLVACGWKPIAEKFKAHVAVVKKLRKDFGWMVALRYCQLVRQGVMRETVDKSIGNYAELQETLLVEAKTVAESFNKRHYKTNPYAPGRPKANICPLTNRPKTNATNNTSTVTSSENCYASTSSYRGNGKGGKGGGGYKGRYDDGRSRNHWRKEDRYGSDRYASHRDKSRSPDRRDKNGNPVKGRKA
ncbi:uncharacterized protein MELLADRAFT_95438 [Melampsora larici-populina 98AG31]|uniref:Uncharacterized protein n=1 Tax=Melampsora larici-populina (strain 98AG31 / pathotype 3-4-7) TaxID=747676 RepID=F4S9B4_MELLP|nr:uncharacterized protein MELLADRAFT_95438 [Melampsora larici-populina 98AG31]EGF98794.1 hypothetical protein MELLADRAFT_95438 [Melampsora larici-populina 98AG31]